MTNNNIATGVAGVVAGGAAGGRDWLGELREAADMVAVERLLMVIVVEAYGIGTLTDCKKALYTKNPKK